MRWRFDLANDIGGRTEQQDRAGVFDVPNRPNDRLVVLADGMGGQQDGGQAAQAVLDAAEKALSETQIDNPKHFLGALCDQAHRAVRQLGMQRHSTPGSTGVFFYISDDEAYWAHIGDSRLYHFDANGLLSQTRDHTVGELLKDNAGEAEAVDADVVCDNRLYTCLGGQNELHPDFGATAIGPSDWFMLCSDGFWNQVDVDEVSGTLSATGPGKAIAADLVALASRRGGGHSDNVSLVLVTRKNSPLAGAWRRVFGRSDR